MVKALVAKAYKSLNLSPPGLKACKDAMLAILELDKVGLIGFIMA
jgi:hypothetical protein